MASPVIQFKRGAFTNLPGLRAGEPALTTDTFDLYVGIDSTTNNNKFFGSHRYWTKETSSTGSSINLVEGTSNGSNYISLKSPDALSGIVTYTLPETITDGYFLKVASNGTLSWENVTGSGASFADVTLSGITTINGSLVVSASSEFTGVATFSSVNIDGGSIDDTIIGAVTPSEGYFTLVDTNVLVSDNSTIGFATATDLHIDSTRVLYDDGTGITLAGIQTVDATTIATLEALLSLDPNDFSTLNVVGISTIGGLLDANGGLDVLGHSELDDINVSGIGTIATADINGGNIDGTIIGASSAAAGTFTELAYNNSSTSGISTVGELYVGTTQVLYDDGGLITLAGIQTVDATTKATLEEILSLDPNDFDTLNVAGISTIGGLLDANGGLDVLGHSELDDVNVSGATTVTSLNATGNVTLGSDNTDTLTVNSNTTFLGTLTGTISTATRATTIDTTATSSDASYYIPFVSNSTSTTGETLRVDSGISYNPSTDTLDVAVVDTGAVRAADGTPAITINNSTGNVSVASSLTVTGDLTVLGSQTVVNTTELKVEDNLIDLGLVNSGGSLVAPSSDANIDIGVLFNYYTDSAKKSGIFWDDSTGRIGIASDLTVTNNVVDTATAVWAPIEIGSLWLNDCAGQSQVINCSAGVRILENITVDGGTF